MHLGCNWICAPGRRSQSHPYCGRPGRCARHIRAHEGLHWQDSIGRTACWSACGHYVAVVAEYYVVGEEHPAVTRGFIWSSVTQQQAFRWEIKACSMEADRVFWAPQGARCLLPMCHVILKLPEDGRDGTNHLQPFNGPSFSNAAGYAMRCKDFSFSPCGGCLVGCWQMRPGPATFTWPGWMAGTTSATWPLPWRLWHVVADGEGHMSSVATSSISWQVDSIAWHPAVADKRMYATADGTHNVHLMDGDSHKRLYLWTWQELSARLSGHRRLTLHWPPDGSQLAVVTTGVTCLISFATSHS